MLRKDYKKIQEQFIKFREETIAKASKSGFHWVLCLWEVPSTNRLLKKRVGYFEEILDANHMKDFLADTYSKLELPFYITTSYGDVKDGGLFDVSIL